MQHRLNTIFRDLGIWAFILCTINAICSLLNVSWYEPYDMDLLIIGVGVGMVLTELIKCYTNKDGVY